MVKGFKGFLSLPAREYLGISPEKSGEMPEKNS